MRKEYDPLYARDSQGRVKKWYVFVEDGEVVKMYTYSGLLDGAMTPQITEVKTGKNIGRSNETSPFQQACKDAESKWQSKRREGYKSLVDLGIKDELLMNKPLKEFLLDMLPEFNTDKDDNIIPMKAQPFYKDDGKTPRIKFPSYGQPKINGVRAFAVYENGKVTLRSKKGLEYPLMTHITDELKKLFYGSPTQNQFNINRGDIVLDGELYIHGEILGNIVSAIRKSNLMTSTVQFHIFDIAVDGLTQTKRVEMLVELSGMLMTSNSIRTVDTIECPNLHSAMDFHKDCKTAGYEGSIFRDRLATYRFGQRPQTMVKLKDRMSSEFKIVDVIHSSKAPGLAIFVCKNDLNEETFKVNPEGSVETKKKYYNDRNKLLGKKLTVEFYERTDEPKSVPFHAVGITVRDYE